MEALPAEPLAWTVPEKQFRQLKSKWFVADATLEVPESAEERHLLSPLKDSVREDSERELTDQSLENEHESLKKDPLLTFGELHQLLLA